jgi:hypothetical protein
MPPLIYDLPKLSWPRNLISMDSLVITSFYPKVQKCLLNASNPPPMSCMVMSFKLILIQKIKISQFLLPRVNIMMTHQTQTIIISKLEIKRYSYSFDLSGTS